jgi:hypothetical protein
MNFYTWWEGERKEEKEGLEGRRKKRVKRKIAE